MCCFWLQSLYIYEIGLTSNFKFEFFQSHILYCWDVILGTIRAKFAEKDGS